MKKTGFYVVSVLIVLVTAVVTFFAITAVSSNLQETAFHASMEEYRKAINAEVADVDTINELSETINCEGYYGAVEGAAKEYMRDLFVPYYTAKSLENKEIFKNGITKKLIESDQPQFEKTIETLDEMDGYLTLIYVAADSLFNRDTALEYFGMAEDLTEDNEYFFGLYEEQVEELYTNEKLKNDLFEYYEIMNKKLVVYKEVIDFLVANNGSWRLEGDSVVFTTTWLTNQYNQMLANLTQE